MKDIKEKMNEKRNKYENRNVCNIHSHLIRFSQFEKTFSQELHTF